MADIAKQLVFPTWACRLVDAFTGDVLRTDKIQATSRASAKGKATHRWSVNGALIGTRVEVDKQPSWEGKA